LGFNVRDREREERLTSRDKRRRMGHYVTRARSAIYESKTDKKPLHTLNTFVQAAQKRPQAAAEGYKLDFNEFCEEHIKVEPEEILYADACKRIKRHQKYERR
jgi:hypothetical protein